jgi:hypothetical protein
VFVFYYCSCTPLQHCGSHVALPLQVAAAAIRPHPGVRYCDVWNIVHHNVGRLAILLAWVNIWLGVAFWHQDGDMPNGLIAWVVPLAGVACVPCALQLNMQHCGRLALREAATCLLLLLVLSFAACLCGLVLTCQPTGVLSCAFLMHAVWC